MFKKSRTWLISLLVIVTIATVLFIHLFKSLPPLEELAEARMNITRAQKIHSENYAGTLFANAEALYDSAMSRWQEENNKLFLFRDFERVRVQATEANRIALASIEKTRVSSADHKRLVSDRIAVFGKSLKYYQTVYGNVPLSKAHNKLYSKAKLLHEESLQAFQSKNYHLAGQKAEGAERLMKPVTEYSREMLAGYFEKHPDWNSWVVTTIEQSRRQQTTCIIVDKYARKCMLYKNGELMIVFEMELGPNWIGDKLHQGDKSTPEGRYKILKKKSGSETKYFKALLLDYPNEEDKQRFTLNKRNGLVRKDAKIGGLIEIHGHGGKGTDWTEGCVALTDPDMERLFAHCGSGTPVTIVGSLESLKELISTTP